MQLIGSTNVSVLAGTTAFIVLFNCCCKEL